ncbi:hypothetical protein [Paramagnetospirillum magneticum]|uniref:Uncharacterized protein n=1 Tax=Paramagnetospirillum magneticum (strain ATCC 700264 / AMB-1) TaxID=342108 RepID=Q2W6G7_PARM1|nr:hypothetical protein [Paramagnetospirillum magneticum]BAE50558.1 hypothetical protein amb1754 [Paramagnetospirillum magneticum AMB-1]
MRTWWESLGPMARAGLVFAVLITLMTMFGMVERTQRPVFPPVFVSVEQRVFFALRKGDCLDAVRVGTLQLPERADPGEFCHYRAGLDAQCRQDGGNKATCVNAGPSH